jgi:TolA-binding protein
LQNELLSKISELNSQQIALHRALSSDKKHAVSYQENKAKLRTLRYRLGQLNEKLSQLQKEGIRKRISIAEQEIHSATLAAEEGGTVEKKSASFITAKHTKNIIESLKALGVSPPDEYAKQILFSIRYGFYAEKGYTTRHAINNALQRIKDNRWFVTSDYDPRKVEGLFRFHLKKTNPNSHLKNKNA